MTCKLRMRPSSTQLYFSSSVFTVTTWAQRHRSVTRDYYFMLWTQVPTQIDTIFGDTRRLRTTGPYQPYAEIVS